VVEQFEEETHAEGLHSCYFAAGERLAAALAARGPWDRILLGAQPVWHPARWERVLERKASLRAQLNRARNKGVEAFRSPALGGSGALHRCLAEWLETRGLPPLHFLVEPETLDRLYDRRLFVARRRDQVVGFLVASPVPCRNGWLIEQNIRGRDAPNGTTELLFDAAVRDIAADGAEYVTLGLCPLSRRAGVQDRRQRWWLRFLLGWVRAHGRRFYNFDGLDAYKAKFLPEAWEPIYAITSERRFGPGTLYAIAGAFGRTPPPWLIARALGRAAREEWRRLRRFTRRVR
jgi:phosphatidylglycerol lysyltransferase